MLLFLSAFTEELCFRSYFYNNINKIIQNKWVCIIMANLLFSFGHIYQGIYGCIYSFVLGMLMSVEYKNRNNNVVNSRNVMCNAFTIVSRCCMLNLTGVFYEGDTQIDEYS
ncbi:MAG: CPBP family intramembrane metalloprotease [Bacteroidales bacterium]|nr:CPBP family intramembrane metalloprotease [Bacteroidales bacterium]